jgi:hypothetical protein
MHGVTQRKACSVIYEKALGDLPCQRDVRHGGTHSMGKEGVKRKCHQLEARPNQAKSKKKNGEPETRHYVCTYYL